MLRGMLFLLTTSNKMTIGLTFFFAFLGISIASPIQSRIVSGENATLEELPYIVQVQWKAEDGWKLACGGVLLSDKVIVTSGQCINHFNESEVRILANSTQLNDGYSRNVAQMIKHENYTVTDNQIPLNDITLLVVDEPFALSERTAPIPLATVEPDNGEPVTIAGWGTSAMDSQEFSQTLLKAELTMVGRLPCDLSYNIVGNIVKITEEMVCSKDTEGNMGACGGDSGGPLVYNGSLVGVVSFSFGCADKSFPLVSSNAVYYSEWINDKLSKIN